MAKSPRYSAQLGGKRQSSGMAQLVVCCLISLLLLTFYVREGDGGIVHGVRGAVETVTTPVQMLGSLVTAPFGALGNAAENLSASRETLSDLKKQNAELTAKVAELSEAEATATRLEGLLGLQSTYKLKSTAARIIGGSGSSWSKTVTIDKGSAAGLTVGMPVCNSVGVIGQIVEVSATSATVRLITDEQSGVSAMIQSSRAQGMLLGQSDGTLRLSYVSADAEAKAGDIVITSGIGGVFPKGLPLGTVSSVTKDSNSSYYTIVVRAQASAESNEEVLVVTALSDDQVASDEEVAGANATPQGSSSTNASAGTSTDGSSGSSSSSTDSQSTDSKSSSTNTSSTSTTTTTGGQ